MRNMYKILVGKRPLGRLRCGWEDNIKMNFRDRGWGVWAGFICLRIEISGGLM
jgi:hypothetical protein